MYDYYFDTSVKIISCLGSLYPLKCDKCTPFRRCHLKQDDDQHLFRGHSALTCLDFSTARLCSELLQALPQGLTGCAANRTQGDNGILHYHTPSHIGSPTLINMRNADYQRSQRNVSWLARLVYAGRSGLGCRQKKIPRGLCQLLPPSSTLQPTTKQKR
ncbi:hypothetical protein DL95DRAFT_163031 [Leptodontidium sp. 2 PMI_412]|nr:hypothetical protein DL95DRAFT_163031 [Leptodontidium sp. 2 PMI_412]